MMKIKVCVQRNNGWEFREVDIDLEEMVKSELIDQCGGIGGIDIERDGFSIESIKANSFDIPLD